MIITIDGPAGSGKSTTARFVANKLGFTYLDTGAMYRAVTLLALEQNLDLHDGKALARIARRSRIEIKSNQEQTRICVDGREVTDRIRDQEVTQNVSRVAGHPQVRREMVRLQREIASDGNYVIEGRDIGTVVFPQAKFKFFMDASIEARAERRLTELVKKGVETSFEKIRKEIIARDKFDSSRETAPLRKPEGAIVIDTTKLTVDEQVDKIIEILTSK
jgi:cytidylate kinase